jgi:LDH2 family malate/lactate/ureidoglycolate dehydrogenase
MLERFLVPEKDRVYVRQERMRAATEAIFRKMGQSAKDAALSTNVLVLADLRGVETHGVSNMVRTYVKWYGDGIVNPRPKMKRFIEHREVIGWYRSIGAELGLRFELP